MKKKLNEKKSIKKGEDYISIQHNIAFQKWN